MALAKKNNFPVKDIQLADWCKALSHPARITILRILASKCECMCTELVLDLPLAQSTVSQHLKALKEVGLIQGEVDGPKTKYCMHKKNIDKFFKLMDQFNYHMCD
jgi:DNA-binding transcriptional ArsR family regulator